MNIPPIILQDDGKSKPMKKNILPTLQRTNHMPPISSLTHVDIQTINQHSLKMTKPRSVDPSSIPFKCLI
jgi:hypothetical protein